MGSMKIGQILLIIATVFSTNADNCVIIKNPETTLLEYNDTVIVKCGVKDESDPFVQSLIVFDSAHTTLTNLEPAHQLEDLGITNANCDQDTKLCTATVLGNDAGLSIHCSAGGCITESAFIYVVNGIPDPPDPPVITFINTMSLNISWNSPWSSSRIPVSSYSLFITDNNTGVQLDTIFTTDRYFIFEKQDNVSCEDVYIATVSADTDLGETNRSDPSSFSFLSDIDDLLAVNYSFIDTYSTYECGASKPTYKVNGIDPDLCPHETLFYSFSSIPGQNGNGDNPLLIVPNATVPEFYFQNNQNGGICKDGECTVWETVIVNEVNDTRRIRDTFDFPNSVQTIVVNDTIHPLTTVALINTNVSFTCLKERDSYDVNSTSSVLILNGVPVNLSMEDNTADHDVEYFEEGYFITITASLENNNTRVQCFILPCFTEEALLIVVKSPPNPVSPPVISIINDTSVLITWSPPWVHPVNMYYVSITEESSGTSVLIGNYTTVHNTYYLLTNNTNGFECDILSATVQAVTDVSTTAPSNATKIPVNKGLKNYQVIESTKSYKFTEGNDLMPPALFITFKPPPVCDHETLEYQFKLKDLLPPNNEVTHNSGGNSSAVIELSSYLFHDDVLMVSVEVNVSDGYSSMIIVLYDNITVMEAPPTDSPHTPSLVIVTAVTICVVLGFIIIILILVLCISFYWYRRLMRVKRGRIVDTVIDDAGFSFSLPPMVVNAQYSTAEEVLYETIHDAPIEPYCTVAPRLPPPRPISQKISEMTCEEEQDFESQLTSKKLEGGEYILMNGTNKADSPRYVKAPSLVNGTSKPGDSLVPSTIAAENEGIETTAFTFEPVEDADQISNVRE